MRGPGALATTTNEVRSNSQLDEYFLFLNYKYERNFEKENLSDIYYYAGAWVGFAYLDFNGQCSSGILNWPLPGNPPSKSESLSTHEFAPALQVFGGIGYDLTHTISFYLGGKAVATDKVEFKTKRGTALSASDTVQLMFEAGLSIRW